MVHDVAWEQRDPAELLGEIARLRAEVTRLEARVEELDRLAHRDALVPLANRRGMLRELEKMIARYDRHGIPSAMLFVWDNLGWCVSSHGMKPWLVCSIGFVSSV